MKDIKKKMKKKIILSVTSCLYIYVISQQYVNDKHTD